MLRAGDRIQISEGFCAGSHLNIFVQLRHQAETYLFNSVEQICEKALKGHPKWRRFQPRRHPAGGSTSR